ncbi:MAG: hypothetical protein D6714_02170 [Bacteroidetes bacterium]|nr:MAG: hypothetical protein D6714_02170 [Bacteroidota bacterium]
MVNPKTNVSGKAFRSYSNETEVGKSRHLNFETKSPKTKTGTFFPPKKRRLINYALYIILCERQIDEAFMPKIKIVWT